MEMSVILLLIGLSAISALAVLNGVNAEGTGVLFCEADAVIADAQPFFVLLPLCT